MRVGVCWVSSSGSHSVYSEAPVLTSPGTLKPSNKIELLTFVTWNLPPNYNTFTCHPKQTFIHSRNLGMPMLPFVMLYFLNLWLILRGKKLVWNKMASFGSVFLKKTNMFLSKKIFKNLTDCSSWIALKVYLFAL